ncbi:DUF305 domain-containing protein [Corynebacterium halotolerans]|uniref:DUF305 domain-containing protein n=1 Tax=Corynebacterium halotolerans YIM 70093 = DSM 44683 TaxID=1121362 RepID=M1NNX2_9CORY|nr:DUF305 domain-containing protein [Corynebacterium halotolerans]AGF71202.1 hypothetical protein A605_00930 [Corynebacterium halotolerans YIM 70093 = DSM 44683]
MNIRNLTPTTRLGTLAAAGALALTLTACGDEAMDGSAPPPDTTTPTTDGETTTSPTGDEGAAEDHNDQDVEFLQGMIPHHEQAVEMSDILLAKEGVDAEVAELAQQIRDSQQAEIEQMTGWLESWGEPVETTAETATQNGGQDSERGALTPRESPIDIPDLPSGEDLEELRNASGDEASSIYLERMNDHHEDAVDMAEEQVDSGQHAEVTDLARSIIENQEAQIGQMEQIQERLGS